MIKPLFIVGVGRSGTSLLQSMFAARGDVFALPETSFLRRYVFALRPNPLNLKDDNIISRVPELRQFTLQESQSYRGLLLDSYRKAGGSHECVYTLDKDPRLIEYVDFIRLSFPESKILHIFRDPRDVLLSKLNAKWSSGRTLLNYLVASRVQIGDAVVAENKQSLVSVQYEKLIDSPEVVLRDLCFRIDMPYDNEMLNYAPAAKQLVQPSEKSWKKETFQPLNSSNCGKWRKGLSPVQALSSVLVVRKFCTQHDYDLELYNYSISQRIRAGSIAWTAIAISKIYLFLRRVKYHFVKRELESL